MKKEYIETMDDLKKYLDSDEYKSMEREKKYCMLQKMV